MCKLKMISIVAFMSLCAGVSAQEINVDVSKKGNPVDGSLYGVFFEEINHAGDGGIYAELVRNRNFEEQDRKSVV